MKKRPVKITPQVIDELNRCANDPVYFISNYVKIQTTNNGNVIFPLRDYQRDAIESFADHRFNVILKCRQLGFSTVTAAYSLWLAIFYTDKAVVAVATKLDTARNFYKKVSFAWNNLPPMFHMMHGVKSETKTEIEFNNGSFIKAITTGQDAGRSEALSMLVVDEAAFIPGFDDLFSQVYPTLETGGRMIVISTPGVVGNQYYEIVTNAQEKRNSFNLITLPWDTIPREPGWEARKRADIGDAKFEREYNCKFMGSDDNFFSDEITEWAAKRTETPKMIVDETTWVWKGPEPGHGYILAADVARGDGGDFSTFQILDIDTFEIVAEDRRHETPNHYAERLKRWAEEYNHAVIAPERNTFGYMVITRLDELGYTNLYYEKIDDWQRVQDGEKLLHKAGFDTQNLTRAEAMMRLESAFFDNKIGVRSSRLVTEMGTFINKKTKMGNVKPEAVKGAHDDLIMALAIAVYAHHRLTTTELNQILNEKHSSNNLMGVALKLRETTQEMVFTRLTGGLPSVVRSEVSNKTNTEPIKGKSFGFLPPSSFNNRNQAASYMEEMIKKTRG
jgi:hypothetical protein